MWQMEVINRKFSWVPSQNQCIYARRTTMVRQFFPESACQEFTIREAVSLGRTCLDGHRRSETRRGQFFCAIIFFLPRTYIINMASPSQYGPVQSQFDKVLKFARENWSYTGVEPGHIPRLVPDEELLAALPNCQTTARLHFPSTKWANLPPPAESDYITWNSEETVWYYYCESVLNLSANISD